MIIIWDIKITFNSLVMHTNTDALNLSLMYEKGFYIRAQETLRLTNRLPHDTKPK